MQHNISSIAVFLGSSEGNSPFFKQFARDFGCRVAQAGLRVIYGGACVGTMGVLADSVLKAGGEIIGVFPIGFGGKKEVKAMNVEIRQNNLSQTIDVKDFAERKAVMEQLSDCAVILPGSFGTLDELFCYAVNNEIGLHDKVAYVLNVNGYYDGLESQVESMKRNGFLDRNASMLKFCHSLDEFMENLSISDKERPLPSAP